MTLFADATLQYVPVSSHDESVDIESTTSQIEHIWRRRFYMLLISSSGIILLLIGGVVYILSTVSCPFSTPGAMSPYCT